MPTTAPSARVTPRRSGATQAQEAQVRQVMGLALQALRAAKTPAQARAATAVLCRLWEGRIRALARAWTGPGLDLDDLAQAATVGLLRAARDANPALPVSAWISYAYTHARKECQRLARKQGRIVMESEQERRHAALVARALVADPDLCDEELSGITGLSVARVARARTGRRGQDQELVDDGAAAADPELDPVERERVRAALADVLEGGLASEYRDYLGEVMDGSDSGEALTAERAAVGGLLRAAMLSRGVGG